MSVNEVRRSLRQDSPAGSAWDIAYLTLAVAGLGAAVRLVLRRANAASIAALLLGLIFILLLLGDEWGDSRFGAPLFITLVLAGLEQRDRWRCESASSPRC